MPIDYRTESANLLLKGHQGDKEPLITTEEMAQEAVCILCQTAENDPSFLIGTLSLYPYSPLASSAISILISKANDSFFKEKYNEEMIIDLLLILDPVNLLEVVKNLKRKIFGKGLGSRAQNLFKKTMETWTVSTLEENCLNYPKSTYALTRLIHPKFRNKKGQIIQKLLDNPPG